MSKTINDYTAANTIDATNDYLLIEQSSVYKRINRNVLLGLASAPLGTTDSQSPTNKTLDNTNQVTLKDTKFTLQDDGDATKQMAFQLSGITTGNTRTLTVPDASLTLVGAATTQTLTNKTLTSPTISGGTIDNSTITVDSIAGHTSSTIVTIANLQISNGVLNSANAVTATSIADGAIQPKALVTGTGSGWAWQSYSPTFANFTIGNGTIVAHYVQTGKTITCRGYVTLGSTSSMGTGPTMTLPVTSNSGYSNVILELIGHGAYNRNGINFFLLSWYWTTTTTVSMLAWAAGGTYLTYAPVTASVPASWASTDTFSWDITYEAA